MTSKGGYNGGSSVIGDPGYRGKLASRFRKTEKAQKRQQEAKQDLSHE